VNSSAWGNFRRQAELELLQLQQLLKAHAALIDKCRRIPPDQIECSALAAMLHSFYTGVENILKRAAREIDRQPIEGGSWHRQLLQQMTIATPLRPALISDGMVALLQAYLGFRHFFRNAYTHTFDWAEMRDLVTGCESTLQRFAGELAAFLDKEPSAEP
jgi:hypothetical protein